MLGFVACSLSDVARSRRVLSRRRTSTVFYCCNCGFGSLLACSGL